MVILPGIRVIVRGFLCIVRGFLRHLSKKFYVHVLAQCALYCCYHFADFPESGPTIRARRRQYQVGYGQSQNIT